MNLKTKVAGVNKKLLSHNAEFNKTTIGNLLINPLKEKRYSTPTATRSLVPLYDPIIKMKSKGDLNTLLGTVMKFDGKGLQK